MVNFRVVCVVLLLATAVSAKKKKQYAEIPEDILDIVYDYAPRLYLHSKEIYNPSGVGPFLKNTRVVDVKTGAAPPQPQELTKENLGSVLSPAQSANARLTSKDGLGDITNPSPAFLRGEKPSGDQVPESYAIVVPKLKGVVDIFYFQFYPFNFGKYVCLGLENRGKRYKKRFWGRIARALRSAGGAIVDAAKTAGNAVLGGLKKVAPKGCYGGWKSFGHHVGDFEHVTLRLVNGEPTAYYFSAHNFGGEVSYDKARKELEFVDDHLVGYLALGSHGVYGSPGRKVYQKIATGGELADECDKGTAWDTWHNLDVIYYKEPGKFTGKQSWMNFMGDWGNKEAECGTWFKKDLYDKVAGQCVMNGGPGGIPAKGWLKPSSQELQ